MPRRKPYTRLKKQNQLRADHVAGMGDVAFRGFQCLNHECTNFLFVREAELDEGFSVVCPDCGYIMEDEGSTRFYDYELQQKNDEGEFETIDAGEFEVGHRTYVEASARYKYCIICNAMKPLEAFSLHGPRQTGRQGECSVCKQLYNSIKNRTRIADQHREASQKRRLYVEISGMNARIDSAAIFSRFDGRCFKCGGGLTDGAGAPLQGAYNLDHTLPAFYLWPLTTDNATLLCRPCNGEKSGKWPNEFYTDNELRALSAKTGLDYDLLSGQPIINPDAIAHLSSGPAVEALLTKYAPYMDEVMKLRNRVLTTADFDFFSVAAGSIAQKWIDEADRLLAEAP